MTKSPPPESGRDRFVANRSALGDPLQAGITIVGVTAIFGGVGWWLDRRFHTFPILLFLGAACGLFGIIYSFVLRLRAQDRAEKHEQ